MTGSRLKYSTTATVTERMSMEPTKQELVDHIYQAEARCRDLQEELDRYKVALGKCQEELQEARERVRTGARDTILSCVRSY